jgi:hypothetical protein
VHFFFRRLLPSLAAKDGALDGGEDFKLVRKLIQPVKGAFLRSCRLLKSTGVLAMASYPLILSRSRIASAALLCIYFGQCSHRLPNW